MKICPRHSKRCQENANGDCKHTGKLFLVIQDPKGQKLAKATQDTQVQSESLRKSVDQILGNPAEQWQWYYRNESLPKAVHSSETFFCWGYGIPCSSGPGEAGTVKALWHACFCIIVYVGVFYGVLIRGDSIQLIMIRVNHSATISTSGIDHNFTFTWLVVPWHKPEKTTSAQSKLTKYHYLIMIYVNIMLT